ncbi:MAG: argininosuccinate lyase [Clostridiales bacterium]|nr:argininosuccinate lyase [Clostridiales bacterium]MCF8022436.1 argininosuccinate lyase [Clostridiales bacterium]
MGKLWSGRFQKETDRLVDDFHSSIPFDKRLYKFDIEGSIAHAKMLAKCEIITIEESKEIVQGLQEVLKDIEDGNVDFSIEAEDIHMNVEQLLTAKIGSLGKKLHTGRSRNDQVALDMHMYVKEEAKEVLQYLRKLQETLLSLAEKHINTVMPGYTHMQRAQPVTFAHHLLAYFEMFDRDVERVQDCYKRADVMPLGAGALAGTTFPLDREFVATELGFGAAAKNSLDAVSDRDFVIEFISCASLIMMHLSRFCEEIILWSTAEFDFIELDDSYSTGSSMMPQKKNPDVAELIRGKSGRVFGSLQGMLTTLKGLPLAYNKDMQEDKEPLFDAADTVKKSLLVFRPMLATMKVKENTMARAAGKGFTNATDMADYLVNMGLAFREAHEVVGKIVLYCIENNKDLENTTLEEYKQFSSVIESDIYNFISVDKCVSARKIYGGPAPETVKECISQKREKLSKNEVL